jgi:hypothetical protein
MKLTQLFALAAFSTATVSFQAFAIDQNVSDFRARSQMGNEQTSKRPSTAMEIDREHPENLAPAAGGFGESGMEKTEKESNDKLMEKKFFHMKR